MAELVSIVIPTYRREIELERALKSGLNQTYKNIEIIIVDDNGLNSEYQLKIQQIINKYVEYENIKYIINEKNLGGSISRNIGIENSEGNYVAFLDDDDEYYPKKLEMQMKLFEKDKNSKLALVYCYTESYDENNKKIHEYKNNFIGNCLVDSMIDCIAATSQWLCKKEYLVNVGKFTDVPCKQDSTLIIKLMNHGYELDRVPEILTRYNEHKQERISGSGLKNIKGEKLLREFCRSLYNKLESHEILKIEISFSYKLCKIYAKNKMYDEFSSEEKLIRKIEIVKWIKLKFYCLLVKCELY